MLFLFKILLLPCLILAYSKQLVADELNEDNLKNLDTTVKDVSDPADDAIEATSDFNTDDTRHGRQFLFQPSWIVTQNFGLPAASTCLTVNGIQGRCVLQGSCSTLGELNNRQKRQFVFITPLISKQFSDGFCLLHDQFGFGHQGICCPAINVVPAHPSLEQTPVQNSTNIDTSETNDLSESDFDTETVVSSTTEQNQAAQPVLQTDFNFAVGSPWPFGDVRYQWPFQFGMQFGGVEGQQWPPSIPNYPTSIANWPPPVPTHPPNHHYPTHPPATTVFTTSRRPVSTQTSTTTTTTTRRPSYPTYTTTQRPTSVSNDVSQTANGLPLQCGKKNPPSPDQQRIVGGNNASPYEFPWIAVLFKSGKQFCGGSLITSNHILSAAHCVAR